MTRFISLRIIDVMLKDPKSFPISWFTSGLIIQSGGGVSGVGSPDKHGAVPALITARYI